MSTSIKEKVETKKAKLAISLQVPITYGGSKFSFSAIDLHRSVFEAIRRNRGHHISFFVQQILIENIE